MNNLANKEKNLNSLIEKLSNLSKSYTHDTFNLEKLKNERNNFLNEKNELEEKHNQLLREHKYLKNKITSLEEELSKKSEIDKWQT
jgi:peptidoglycan hydrolase CwlO-like protein